MRLRMAASPGTGSAHPKAFEDAARGMVAAVGIRCRATSTSHTAIHLRMQEDRPSIFAPLRSALISKALEIRAPRSAPTKEVSWR